MPSFRKAELGFTLIELLVVIAIIGVLSVVILVSLNSARSRARDARRVADVREIRTAMELYYIDNTAYPDDGGSCVASSGGAAVAGLCPDPAGTGPSGGTNNEFRDYMAVWPTAPAPADGGCTTGAPGSAGTNDYVYSGRNSTDTADVSANPAFYNVTFCLGTSTGGLAAGAHTATPERIN